MRLGGRRQLDQDDEGLVHGRQGGHPQPAEPGGVQCLVSPRGRSAAADDGLRRLGLPLLPQAQPGLLRDHERQGRAVARDHVLSGAPPR
jgi:hypothetical protein